MSCKDFLLQVIPFSKLPESMISHICETANTKSFGKGEYIFRENQPFLGALLVVSSGLVELNIQREKEIILGYRGEGDVLGEDAFISKSPYRYNAVCVEDSTVIFVSADLLDQIAKRNPEFYSQLAQLMAKRLEVFYKESQELSEAEHIPSFFRKRIGDVFKYKKPVFAEESLSIKDLAKLMKERKTSAVLIKSKTGKITGIVTEHDIVVKHVAEGKGQTAADIMSSRIIKKSPQDLCYQAALEMIRNKIKHVVVEDEGKIIGILNILDLIEHETLTYIDVLTEINEAEKIDDVARQEKRVLQLVKIFLDNNFSSEELCEIISHINDEAVKKAIELAIREIGPPPCSFCFLALGSHGRKEQTIKTDQDNAIIFKDPKSENYFKKLSEKICDFLEIIGFPKCPANVMASNPEWRGDDKTWRKRLHDLFVNPVPEKILKFSIIFDNRIIYGDETLEYEFYNVFQEGLREHPGFIARLGKIACEKKPPIGLFGNFIVEKSGEHKNEIDIKLRAALPIVECVRVLSLIHNIRKTNTFDRLEELKNKSAISENLAEEVRFAYDFIYKLRLKNHINLIFSGQKPHNYINPRRLTGIERKLLKECFATIYKLQKETFKQAGSIFVP